MNNTTDDIPAVVCRDLVRRDLPSDMIDQHEREVTGIDWSKPSPEPHKLRHRIPGWDEIPEEFRQWGEPVVANWIPREGINETEAEWHLKYISNSWEYAVEHKRAALRWLRSLWFTDGVKPNDQAELRP